MKKGDNVFDQLACVGEDLAEGLRQSAVKMRRLVPHLSIICRVRGHRVASGLVGNPVPNDYSHCVRCWETWHLDQRTWDEHPLSSCGPRCEG
jgi:hypothetical protein